MKNVLYLHGFASSPRGRKVAALTERLAPRGIRILAPDLNVPSFERLDFKVMTRLACWDAKKHRPAAVVGSSLGALVALEVARAGTPAPLLLIAPALGFGARWTEKLPADGPLLFFHHSEQRELPIHQRFFEEMARVDADEEPPAVPVVIVMGRRDESVPFDGVRAVWDRWERGGRLAPGSRFVEIGEGDHGLLDHVDRIALELRALLGE